MINCCIIGSGNSAHLIDKNIIAIESIINSDGNRWSQVPYMA